MPNGKIKTLKNGFGFIAPDDGAADLFFHMTELDPSVDFNSLALGQAVSYETADSEKGPKATQVKLA